jgi:hypothetical protein
MREETEDGAVATPSVRSGHPYSESGQPYAFDIEVFRLYLAGLLPLGMSINPRESL